MEQQGKSKILTGSNIQFAILLLGITIFVIFLSYTPRIMENFLLNTQQIQELEKSFLAYAYTRRTEGIRNSTDELRTLEKRLSALRSDHLIHQISTVDTDFALLLKKLTSNLDSYIALSRDNAKKAIPPLVVQNTLHHFKEIQGYSDEYAKIQVFTLQMTNVFIITLMLLMGVINMYIILRRRRELRSKVELRTLHKNTILEIARERKAISSAIHDRVLQDMEMARRDINTLITKGAAEALDSDLKSIETGMTSSIKSLRKVLEGLPVWDTTSFSFEENIRNLVQEIKMHSTAQIEITLLGLKKLELSTLEMEQLLSIIHEALCNAVKHAKASIITVKALRAEGRLKLIVRDNGVGFHPKRLHSEDEIHIGLLSMQEQAWTIGADFELKSSPGRGTTITLILNSQ